MMIYKLLAYMKDSFTEDSKGVLGGWANSRHDSASLPRDGSD